MATKGHLMIGDGSGVPSMLGVGSNNQVLTACSGEGTGVKWAAASGGGCVVCDCSPQLSGSLDAQTNTILNIGHAGNDIDAGGYNAVAGSNSAPSYAFTCDADMGFYYMAAGRMGWSANGGVDRIVFDGCGAEIFVRDSANAKVTNGITINQATADNGSLDIKSSDIAHAMTGYVEADTYFQVIKRDASAGGAALRGFRDADGVGANALTLWGILGENPCSTHSASGYGVVNVTASETDGSTGVQTIEACENLFSIDNHTTTRFIIAGDGDVFSTDSDLGGGIDYFDDLMLIRSTELVRTQTPGYCAETACYKGIIKSQHDDWTRDHYAELKAAGLYDVPPWEGGLLNTSQWRRLANGAIWKLYIKVQDQAAEILGLKHDMKALKEA